jgi:hypothetical protein
LAQPIQVLKDKEEDGAGFGISVHGTLDALEPAIQLIEELDEIEAGHLGAEAIHGHLVGRAAADFAETDVMAAEELVAEGELTAAASVREDVGAKIGGIGHGSGSFEKEKGPRLAALLFVLSFYFIKPRGNQMHPRGLSLPFGMKELRRKLRRRG